MLAVRDLEQGIEVVLLIVVVHNPIAARFGPLDMGLPSSHK